jgi:hypothetical protein
MSEPHIWTVVKEFSHEASGLMVSVRTAKVGEALAQKTIFSMLIAHKNREGRVSPYLPLIYSRPPNIAEPARPQYDYHTIINELLYTASAWTDAEVERIRLDWIAERDIERAKRDGQKGELTRQQKAERARKHQQRVSNG